MTRVYEKHPKVEVVEFLPELSYEFPEASDDMLIHHLTHVISDFCVRARVLTRDVVIETYDCVEAYPIELDDGYGVVDVLDVRCGRQEIPVYTASGARRTASGVWLTMPNIIHIVGVHDSVNVRFTVYPMTSGCHVDAVLLNKYGDTILHGVRARMYRIGRQPWTDANSSQMHLKLYELGIDNAAVATFTNGRVGAFKMRTRFGRL